MQEIVIIGGGPAGLTAAYELLKGQEKKYHVTILEESDSLGGISRTVSYRGNRMDIGGHRFFSKNDEIMAWWKKLMPLQGKPAYDDRVLGISKPYSHGGPDPEKEDRVMLVRNRVSRIYYKNAFFDYPVTMNMDTIRNMGLITTFRAGMSYLLSCIHKLPEDNLENFYINRFGRVLYSMFFEGYTEKVWGRHPREISADWGAQRAKGLSVLAVLKDMLLRLIGTKNNANAETSLIEQFWYPKYGPGQLWELVGKEVQAMGGEICFRKRVHSLKMENGRIQAVVAEGDDGDQEYPADIVLSSMAIKDLIRGMEETPKQIRKLSEELPYRDFVTVGLLVDHLKIKNRTKRPTLGNIVPDCWIYVQDRSVLLGRIQIFNNWSPYMVEKPEDSVWIGLEYFCNEEDSFWNLPDKKLAKLALTELKKMGIVGKNVLKDYHVERVKKAYPAYFGSYGEFDKIRSYLDGYENLWCIGRNGQHHYNNMDHSMLTAMRAVEAIRRGSTEKSEVWNVNIEKEYHEKK